MPAFLLLRAGLGIAVAIGASSFATASHAQGLLDFLFGGPPSSGSRSAGNDSGNPRARITVTPRRPKAAGAPSSSGHLVCVRLCDGYQFPLSHTSGDKAANAFMCQLGCPGAETKVFRRRGEKLDDAVAEDNGKSVYKRLANANAFQKSSSATCGCFSTNAVRGVVFDDPTMRAGDIVMVDGKAMTLKPGAEKPYDKSDYIAVERSKSVPASVRNMLRAKLASIPVVARTEARRARGKRGAEKPAAASSAIQSPAMSRDGVRIIMPSPFDAPIEAEPAMPDSASSQARPSDG